MFCFYWNRLVTPCIFIRCAHIAYIIKCAQRDTSFNNSHYIYREKMAEENNGKNSSIPRGYLTEDTKARLEWVKKYSGIELDDSASDKAEDLQGIIERFCFAAKTA